MSHELRTPLNAVLGFAQLLERDELTADQRESVAQILRAGKLLLDLINEVLDISRIASGKLGISSEPVDVADVTAEVVALMGPLAASSGVTILTGDGSDPTRDGSGPHVLADRQRLKQVLINLVSNGVKYNRRGGTVTVLTRPGREGRLRISVGDTGPGIPAERISRLFDPFDRLGAEQSEVEGTGLGLTLSRSLVDAMGGSLEVASEQGVGSTFTVDLALTESQMRRHERGTRPQPRRAGSSAPRLLLYIEDNLSNLRLVERVLADRDDVKLISALQGRIGLDLARQHTPNLVLLDLHLPDIPGEEVLRQLQQQPETRDIPVVVMSADATRAAVDRLVRNGARAYLTKPLDVEAFLDAVDRFSVDPAAQPTRVPDG
jgi:hypothetical protein